MNSHGPRPVDLAPGELRQRRLVVGLTQEALAYRAGVSLATVRRIERGAPTTRGTLQILAIALADASK